jgi:hypothetical protein
MERDKSPKAVDALKLMHFAASLDPVSVIKESEDDGVFSYVMGEAAEADVYGITTHAKISTIFSQGVYDVDSIINNAFTDYGKDIAQIRALEIVTHDISVETIARYALLPEKKLRSVIDEQRHYNRQLSQGYPADRKEEYVRCFIVDDASNAITVNPDYDNSWDAPSRERGCPFAKPIEKRPLVFDDFVRWAGQIAVLRYGSGHYKS